MTSEEPIHRTEEHARQLFARHRPTWRLWSGIVLLAAECICLGAVLLLWATEPGPLPSRTHAAFAIITAAAGANIALLLWALARGRRVLSAHDHVIAASIGVTSMLLLFALTLWVVVGRTGWPSRITAISVSGGWLIVAIFVWIRAVRRRRTLIARRDALLRQTAAD